MPEPVPMNGSVDYNVPDGKMLDLPCVPSRLEDGTPILVTKWSLNAAEVAEIARTGYVYVMVVGTTHQPIMLSAVNPIS